MSLSGIWTVLLERAELLCNTIPIYEFSNTEAGQEVLIPIKIFHGDTYTWKYDCMHPIHQYIVWGSPPPMP